MSFPGGSDIKESTCNAGDLGLILDKRMATHSSILSWRIPWTEEPGGLQSMGSQQLDTAEWLTLSLFCCCCIIEMYYLRIIWYKTKQSKNINKIKCTTIYQPQKNSYGGKKSFLLLYMLYRFYECTFSVVTHHFCSCLLSMLTGLESFPIYFHVLSNLALGRHSINVIRFSKEGKKKEKVFGGESGEGKGKEMRDSNAK